MQKSFPISPHLYDRWFLTPRGQKVLAEEKNLLKRMVWREKGFLLDIGCGTGIFTLLFQELGFFTLGLDLSREMLLHFKEKAPFLPLIQGDAHSLPLGKDSLEYASLITVLEFLDHPFYALVEATRVASRGLLVAFLPPWAPVNLKRRIKGTLGTSTFKGASFLSSSTLKAMVKEACRINGRRIKGIKVEGCLFPGRISLVSLAAFAVMKVDYE